MKKVILLILSLVWTLNLFSQKHDYWWLTGYGGGTLSPANDSFGVTLLNFNNEEVTEPQITGSQSITLDMIGANTSMCDSAGNLLFYTNGIHIYNKNYQIMQNGNSINPGDVMYGAQIPLSVLALPRANHPQQYYLISVEGGLSYPVGLKLHFNLIDMTQNNGKGKVIDRRHTIINDSLYWGNITCTKHANGRDWWIIAPLHERDKYYSVLLQPDSFIVYEHQYEIPFDRGGGKRYFLRMESIMLILSVCHQQLLLLLSFLNSTVVLEYCRIKKYTIYTIH